MAKKNTLKYRQFKTAYGAILVYEDDTVQFIPSNWVSEAKGFNDDLDFDNFEIAELIAEDEIEVK